MQATITQTTAPTDRPGWSVPATLLLVGLADYLILTTVPGIGWFVAMAATAAVVGGHAMGRGRTLQSLAAVAVGVIGAMPFVEAPSIPALLVAVLGLGIAALLAVGLLPKAIEAIPGVLLRFGARAPVLLLGDCIGGFSDRVEPGAGSTFRQAIVGWIVPLIFVAIFLWLFVAANPILDMAAAQLGGLRLPDPLRLVGWAVLAVGFWALLRPRLLPALNFQQPSPATTTEPKESLLFGRAAILRSLVIFNAIFAVQTAMDLTYLWGGVALPDGMTYADYAHHGAQPLILTTLLAAGFVLVAMRRDGPGIQSALIRRLVYVWIAQNILLCVSSILRLDLYVEAYSLTEMRVIGGIWMGLVAVGLLLILLRIVLGRSNAWLMATNLMSLAVTLYGCAWIDFSALIARFNVEHSREISGAGVELDLHYLAQLGPTVLPALDDYVARIEAEGSTRYLPKVMTAKEIGKTLEERFRHIEDVPEDWRGWTWRGQRLLAYLDSVTANDDNQADTSSAP